jgi:hypothetical protein
MTMERLILCLLLLPLACNALEYREEPDLDGQMLTLDVGVNHVSAEARFIAGAEFDPDYFYFTIPTDARVAAITLAWESALVPETGLFDGSADYLWGYDTDEGPIGERREVSLNLLSAGQTAFGSLPVADFYRLFFLGQASANGGGTVAHDWTIYVTQLAEPGTLLLLALGLAGLYVALSLGSTSINTSLSLSVRTTQWIRGAVGLSAMQNRIVMPSAFSWVNVPTRAKTSGRMYA